MILDAHCRLLNPVLKLYGRVKEGVRLFLHEELVLLIKFGYVLEHHLATRYQASSQEFVEVRPRQLRFKYLLLVFGANIRKPVVALKSQNVRLNELLPQSLEHLCEKDEHVINRLY